MNANAGTNFNLKLTESALKVFSISILPFLYDKNSFSFVFPLSSKMIKEKSVIFSKSSLLKETVNSFEASSFVTTKGIEHVS